MRALLPFESSRPQPCLGEVPDPVPGAGEVLVEVRATALNRADLLQMKGLYPPPAGESAVPGLECAGIVLGVGEATRSWLVGERVMALLAGGGHAERVVVPEGQLMAIPETLSFEQAAALPEAFLTAWTNLVVEGGLAAGETVLVTAAASGIGTMVCQMARELGARVIAAGRSLERLEPLRDLGASHLVELGSELPAAVRAATGGRGADLVFDMVGGPQFVEHVAALAPRGRLILIGLLAGARAEIPLDLVLTRRLRILGSVLRPRSRGEKADLVAGFAAWGLPRLADGRLRPVVDRVLPFEQLPDAYRQMAEGGATGKIVVRVR
ncbi:MAG: NAD(P)H-quinone oxidoreductase [Thermoanaerobaculia bacterium]|nr:NAD(P)H-quinone oxidoreductase [Thermoanaerobaculia bacterium]